MSDDFVPGPLMVDLQTTSLSDEERDLLQHPLVGGVILFTRNYESIAQLKKLLADIRTLREPLLIAVDQEGGRVQRFRSGFTLLPPLAKPGEFYIKNPQQAMTLAEDHGYTMAHELLAVGVDFSFAPVLDVNTSHNAVIGSRSFGAQPDKVCDLGRAYIHGMRKAGMAATGKHFPGHGAVLADSHQELPVDDRDWQTLWHQDLVPFARLANDLAAIMTAHVIYPQIDKAPCTFSPYWLQQVLRNQLNFQGAIFSDDLGMLGAAWAGNLLQRTEAALAAGCDMVLLCNQRAGVHEVLAGLNAKPDPAAQSRLLAMRGQRNM